MAESVLNNPGFYGADGRNYSWIGQIADDSTWRDNTLAGKFKSFFTIPGWGKRYKVRIMGIHDKQQETIPDDQLPWATIEYPTTAGSGGGNSFQTANLKQGMFVSGYFMDGPDQNVPVITGVLGQNAQAEMQSQTGMTGGEAFESMSSYSETKEDYPGTTKPKVPEEGLVIDEETADTATPPPGSIFDEFGLPNTIPKTPMQLAMIASGVAEGEVSGLTGNALSDFVKGQVASGVSNAKSVGKLATRPPIKNPTKENPDAVHMLSAADLKRDKKMCEKIVTMKTDNIVQSSMTAMQTEIENLTKKIEDAQEALRSYTGAVSGVGDPVQDMNKLIAESACQQSKYMKIIFDKVKNYTLKTLNVNMTEVVSSVPSSMRYQVSDLKEESDELTSCLYGKITDSLCGTIADLLTDLLNPDELKRQAEQDALTPRDPNAPNTFASVPSCVAEDIVGEVFALHADTISDANNTLLDNINNFLDDLQSQLGKISGLLGGSDAMSKLGGIQGNLNAALGFENVKTNLFGCELPSAPSESDFYTMCKGGTGVDQQSIPSFTSVAKKVAEKKAGVIGDVVAKIPKEIPFTQPLKGQLPINIA